MGLNVLAEVRCATTGKLLQVSCGHNTVVDTGLELIGDVMLGLSLAPMYIAVGTDNTAVTTSDTALGTEVFRNVITRRNGATGQRMIYQLYLDTDDANGYTLREGGIFVASSGGVMLSRVLLSPTITKTVAVTATLTWKHDYAEA